jgi:hypothetical protein
MVEETTNALLAPPGMGMFVMGAVWELVQGATLQGNKPDCWPRRKIVGATGTREMDA